MTVSMHTVLTKAGGPAALARNIGEITPQAISQWDRVPATRVIVVERITGIPREELRPDIFAREPEEPAQ